MLSLVIFAGQKKKRRTRNPHRDSVSTNIRCIHFNTHVDWKGGAFNEMARLREGNDCASIASMY